MKKNKTLIALIGILVLVIAVAYVMYDKLASGYQPDALTVTTATPEPAPVASETPAATPAPETEPEEPTLAPDFTVYDAEGNAVHLSDFIGTPVVLNFWASWCMPCTSEMPAFDEKYKELDGQVQLLMVNLTDGSRETVEGASDFIASCGYTFPIYFDTSYSAAMAYGVSSIPASYFIGADGAPVAYAIGALDADTLQRGIDMLLQP